MAGVTKVNGFVLADQFFGRDIYGITISTMTACPADVDSKPVTWPDLNAAVQAVQTISTVAMVGVRPAGATVVNLLLEGTDPVGDKYVLADGTTPATLLELLAELTGQTVVVFPI